MLLTSNQGYRTLETIKAVDEQFIRCNSYWGQRRDVNCHQVRYTRDSD